MYFVDQKQIKEKLHHMDQVLTLIPQIDKSSMIERFSLERMVHTLIESVIDVGHLMIDGFIMRDAGSYKDIITILVDEKVLPTADEAKYHALIDLRAMLVNDYTAIDYDKITETLDSCIEEVKQFSQHINQYLAHELDVANAFTNND